VTLQAFLGLVELVAYITPFTNPMDIDHMFPVTVLLFELLVADRALVLGVWHTRLTAVLHVASKVALPLELFAAALARHVGRLKAHLTLMHPLLMAGQVVLRVGLEVTVFTFECLRVVSCFLVTPERRL